jgi:hypothetical protein
LTSIYIEEVADRIRRELGDVDLPEGNTESLFRLYAVLCLTVGRSTSAADVHHAWVSWMSETDPNHPSLVPLEQLDEAIAASDEPFAAAIRRVAISLADESSPVGKTRSMTDDIDAALLPNGPPRDKEALNQFFELYKMMVQSSEALVARRQQVNTFFLTMNGALLTAVALFLRGGVEHVRLQAAGVAVLAIAGFVLSIAWRSLLVSFGQLNTGKFAIINRMERSLSASIYAGEWKALKEGKDPRVYRTFTSREVWVPNSFLAVYGLTCVLGSLIWAGVLKL